MKNNINISNFGIFVKFKFVTFIYFRIMICFYYKNPQVIQFTKKKKKFNNYSRKILATMINRL